MDKGNNRRESSTIYTPNEKGRVTVNGKQNDTLDQFLLNSI